MFIMLMISSMTPAQFLLINEVDLGSRQIEILNPGGAPIPPNHFIQFFRYNGLTVGPPESLVITGYSGEIIVFPINLFPPGTTHVGIIVVDTTNGYDAHDSFGFIIDEDSSQPFVGDLSPWNGKAKMGDDGQTYQRCFSSQPKHPEAFFQTASTSPGQENPCGSDIIGDPHFLQTLIDHQANEPISICYDVSGQSGQSIFILQDKLVETRVEGILLDDYYMHEIRLEMKREHLIIGTKLISFHNKIYKWNTQEIFYLENARIECLSNEKMMIEIWRKDNGSLKMIIEKSKNNFGIEHLDVGFPNLDLDSTRYGGLLGDIQQKKVSVLKSGIRADKECFVEVEGKEIVGRLEVRGRRECVLIPLKELVKPKKMADYVR